jgi:pimeloyl-ACP methyl ester carboxylesterase
MPSGADTSAEAISEHVERHAGFMTRTLTVAGQGPAFLLLHGLSDSADTWRPLLRELANRGRRATAVDLPSHGRADPLHVGQPNLVQLVDFAEAAATALGPGTVVVGNSLGGTVALLLAERSAPLGGVVPIAPGAFAHPLWLRLWLHPHLLALRAQLPPYATQLLTGLAGLVAGMPPGYLKTFVSHAGTRDHQRRLRNLAGHLHHEAQAPYDHTRIRCPVMLLWGDRDRVSLPLGARHLVVALPDVRYEALPGAGHCPQHQRPARIADLLCEFASEDGQIPGSR